MVLPKQRKIFAGFLIAAFGVFALAAPAFAQELGFVAGTLASFGWALIAAYVTLVGLDALPPLGIPTVSP